MAKPFELQKQLDAAKPELDKGQREARRRSQATVRWQGATGRRPEAARRGTGRARFRACPAGQRQEATGRWQGATGCGPGQARCGRPRIGHGCRLIEERAGATRRRNHDVGRGQPRIPGRCREDCPGAQGVGRRPGRTRCLRRETRRRTGTVRRRHEADPEGPIPGRRRRAAGRRQAAGHRGPGGPGSRAHENRCRNLRNTAAARGGETGPRGRRHRAGEGRQPAEDRRTDLPAQGARDAKNRDHGQDRRDEEHAGRGHRRHQGAEGT